MKGTKQLKIQKFRPRRGGLIHGAVVGTVASWQACAHLMGWPSSSQPNHVVQKPVQRNQKAWLHSLTSLDVTSNRATHFPLQVANRLLRLLRFKGTGVEVRLVGLPGRPGSENPPRSFRNPRGLAWLHTIKAGSWWQKPGIHLFKKAPWVIPKHTSGISVTG